MLRPPIKPLSQSLKVAALRFVVFEDLGVLAQCLRRRGAIVDYLDACDEEHWEQRAADANILIVLGGPIAAYDTDRYPVVQSGLRVIERHLSRNHAVLGICLGAQMIARVLGARSFAMNAKEIGWAGVDLSRRGLDSALQPLSSGACVLHWHGDTFELPRGADHLASSPTTENQAFQFGPSVLGLQFHLEVDCRCMEHWLIGHACEIAQAGLDPRQLRAEANVHGATLAGVCQDVFNRWLDGAVSPTTESLKLMTRR